MRKNKNGDTPERDIHLSVMEYIRHHRYLRHYVLHFPNESKRSPSYGRMLQQMGMRKGVSDLLIAMPRHNYCGAWIEIKTEHGKPTKEQIAFLKDMQKENYFTCVTYGFDETIDCIKWYCFNSGNPPFVT